MLCVVFAMEAAMKALVLLLLVAGASLVHARPDDKVINHNLLFWCYSCLSPPAYDVNFFIVIYCGGYSLFYEYDLIENKII